MAEKIKGGALDGATTTFNKDSGEVRVRKPLNKDYWEESPITEEQHDEYSKYEQKYVGTLIASVKDVFNDNEGANKVTISANTPGGRVHTIRAATGQTIRNNITKEVKEDQTTVRLSVANVKSVYKDDLSDLLESLS